MINPVPPALNGLHWRRITCDDLPALVALADVCQRADGGLAFLNKPDNLLERYFPNPAVTGQGAWVETGQLVAGNIIHGGETPGQPLTMVGQVVPAWRQQGLGRYLIRWGLAQAVSVAPGSGRLQICTESFGFIVQLGVIPEMRRRGLASALLVAAMQRMQLAGEPAAQLTVDVNNPGAIAAYQQLGFVAAGRRARFERLLA